MRRMTHYVLVARERGPYWYAIGPLVEAEATAAADRLRAQIVEQPDWPANRWAVAVCRSRSYIRNRFPRRIRAGGRLIANRDWCWMLHEIHISDWTWSAIEAAVADTSIELVHVSEYLPKLPETNDATAAI